MEDVELMQLTQKMLASGMPLDPMLKARIDALFDEMRPRVARLCTNWVLDGEQGEELAQEAIAEAWRKLPEHRWESSFKNFVVGIARNMCRNRRRRISEYLTEDGVVDPISEEGGTLDQMRDEEQERILLAAIAELPRPEQEALYWKYAEGLTVDQITLRMGLANATGARAVLQKARRHLELRLREVLTDLGHTSSFFRTSAT